MREIFDIVIVGAGPAGMTAAIYGQRAGKKTLLIDQSGFGGQILNTPEIENYPAIKKISGFEFSSQLFAQAKDLGAQIKYERVVEIKSKIDEKEVVTENGSYLCRSIILATGAKNRPLGIDREEELTGSGVSYCATCDGAFFRGRTVAVIGGGNTALEDAESLSDIAEKVFLVHRRNEFRGDVETVNRLKNKEKVEFVMDSVPEEIVGENTVQALKVRNKVTGEVAELPVQGIFVAVGQMPDNGAFSALVELNESGYIIGNEDCKTSAEGIFVAGDCREKKVRQLTTATADGAVAALAAVEYINSTRGM